MARTAKTPPKVSPQVWRIFSFLRSVRDGRITAASDSSAPTELRAVAKMLYEILQGADPNHVFGLGDPRTTLPRSAFHRDQRIATDVLAERAVAANLEVAIATVAERRALAESTVRDAYHEHKAHARAILRLRALMEVGETSANPD
jgi:hypothetical protein